MCGIVIFNEKGVTVHGKNAWQHDSDIPAAGLAGSRIFCRQEVVVRLGPGEYTFELGLASVEESELMRRDAMSHNEWAATYSTVCVVTPLAAFLSISPLGTVFPSCLIMALLIYLAR